jgi:hypothetical protein
MTLNKLILLSCLSVLPGCATIIHGGSSQGVGISSTPPGAKVTVDGVPSGVTPVIVDMKRNRDHKV